MKILLQTFLILLILPTVLLSQNQGNATPLGSGGSKILCNVNTSLTSTASNGQLNFPACDAAGALYVAGITPGTSATSLGKAEDAPAANGDTGVPALFKALYNGGVAQVSADGDYIVPTTTKYGAVYVDLNKNHVDNPGASVIKSEDAPAANADGVIAVAYITQDPLSVDQNAGGDYAQPKLDRSGRVITTLAPAGESWQACGTATAVTSDVAIKAAVASNRIYVTAITCSSSSATVATNLNFKDATTVMAVGGVSQMAAGASGSFTANFPVPLRGTLNTALNFNTGVATTSVICCASGYVATN